MLEQIKDLCLFMICGQTLLYFQSGKKYEKICRMILELLILAGIVGMILNFLQSLGFREGEMEAAGGAVAGMQRSIEEALSKQLGVEELEKDLLAEEELEKLIERHTEKEIKSKYNYFARQYGFEIREVENQVDKLRVILIRTDKEEADYGAKEERDKEETDRESVSQAGEPAKSVKIEQIEIKEIILEEAEEKGAGKGNGERTDKEHSERSETSKKELETFRRQFALVLAIEEERLEVILID